MTKYEKAVALWQEKSISTASRLAEVLNAHSISFAYNSGKIENINITYNDTREVFEHDGVTSYTGDLRTLFELRNAKDAYELFLTAFKVRRPFDESFIKALQGCLTKNTYNTQLWQLGERPGEYKIHDYFIDKEGVIILPKDIQEEVSVLLNELKNDESFIQTMQGCLTKNTYDTQLGEHPGEYKKHDYVTDKEEVGALPEDVEEEISELLGELEDIDGKNALTAAAYFHAKFENIHPFADGNGRTGRLAMNYLLVLHNHPPIIIYEENRKAYYSALESWDRVQDLTTLCDFLKFQTEKTWDKQI